MKLCLLLLVLVACVPQPVPVPPDPEPAPTLDPNADPWADPDEPGLSVAARKVCGRLRALKCQEGKLTAEGASCERVLDNATKEGIDLIGDVACVERATSCEQARGCERN